MKKAIMSVLTVWILVNVGLFSLIILSPEIKVQVSGATIIVDDNGTPGVDCNYTTIQEGIDAANPGDTVFVRNGTYYEHVLVNKTINLTGEDRNTTIIDGGGSGDVIQIEKDWVNITGFTIMNSGSVAGDAGLLLYSSSNNKIINNNLSFNEWAVSLEALSNNNNITKNFFFSNYEGIRLDESSDNNIFSNRISLIERIGIMVVLSSNNDIVNNTIFSGDYKGIILALSSHNNLIKYNLVYSIANEGINIWSSSNNIVTFNIVANNGYGIGLESGSSNTIYQNNIISNTNQAYDYTNNQNQWDNGYPAGGNFWSDYSGVDYNSTPTQNVPPPDGIGDTNYSIDSDSVDNYPLMNPIGNFTYLYEGWNLISLPFIQPDTNIDSVLLPINDSYDAVQWYNTIDSSDSWKHYQISKPSHLNDFTDIGHTIGFWIHITEPGGVLFEYSGTQPSSNQSISLHPGWNMVGYPSHTNRNRTAALNNLTFGIEVDAIWTFNNANKNWEEIKAGDNFEVGRGYWIHATQECVWEVRV